MNPELEQMIRQRFTWQRDKYALVTRMGNSQAQQRLYAYMGALNFTLRAANLKEEEMP